MAAGTEEAWAWIDLKKFGLLSKILPLLLLLLVCNRVQYLLVVVLSTVRTYWTESSTYLVVGTVHSSSIVGLEPVGSFGRLYLRYATYIQCAALAAISFYIGTIYFTACIYLYTIYPSAGDIGAHTKSEHIIQRSRRFYLTYKRFLRPTSSFQYYYSSLDRQAVLKPGQASFYLFCIRRY